MNFKKIIIGLSLALTTLSAADTVTFKLEGKMGEEIKALIEKYKYSLETVTINKQTSNATTEEIMAKVEAKLEAKAIKKAETKKLEDIKIKTTNGKELYTNKCKSCHGKQGELEAYNRSRPLNTLSLEEITDSIRGYTLNEYDRGLAIMMAPIASSLTEDDIDSVYNYLKTLK